MLKKFYLRAEVFLFQAFFFLIYIFRGKNRKKKDIKKVLFACTTAIGDTLLCEPVLRYAAKKFESIFVLMDRRRLLLLQHAPYIEKIFLYKGKYKNFFQLIKQIRKEDIDASIVLHANDPDIIPILYLSTHYVIGPAESKLSFLLSQSFFNDERLHFTMQRMKMLEAFGLKAFDDIKPMIYIPEEVENRIERMVNEIKKPFILVHPFASIPAKRWSFSKWVKLLKNIKERYNLSMVIIGGWKEKEEAEKMAEEAGVLSFAGNLNLLEVAAFIKRALLLITLDSGPMHIAAAVRKKTVALFGPKEPSIYISDPSKQFVIRKRVACQPCKKRVCKEHICMDRIEVEDVLRVIGEVFHAP